MHPASLIELAHAGVYDRIAGLPIAPGLKQPVAFRARFTRRGGAGPKRSVDDAWKRRKHLLEELSPNDFIDPGEHIGTRHAAACRQSGQRCMYRGTRRQRSETEMRRQLRSSVDGGKIPVLCVAVDRLAKKPE